MTTEETATLIEIRDNLINGNREDAKVLVAEYGICRFPDDYLQ